MEENSDENSTVVRVSDVEKAHNSDGDGGLSSVDEDHHNDDEVFMKNMISNHPLFGLLIETHINCLKVGMESESEDEKVVMISTRNEKLVDEAIKDKLNESSSIPTPELDNFMEVYCIALKKLKEAMEEPMKDAKSFINSMYEQLNDL